MCNSNMSVCTSNLNVCLFCWNSITLSTCGSYRSIIFLTTQTKFCTFSCCCCCCCCCCLDRMLRLLSLQRLFWNQTLITRGLKFVISTSCSFIKASGRGLALYQVHKVWSCFSLSTVRPRVGFWSDFRRDSPFLLFSLFPVNYINPWVISVYLLPDYYR